MFYYYYTLILARYAGSEATPSPGLRANMEGKTKEKLENIGLSLLCVAMTSQNPLDNWCKYLKRFLVKISEPNCLPNSLPIVYQIHYQ